MYAQVPASLNSFVRNQFFAAYPTSDMIATAAPILTSQMHYIHTDAKTEIATKEYFVQDGSYIDPMKDVLTVFGSLPKESTLILQYGYRFRQSSSWSQKLRKTIKK